MKVYEKYSQVYEKYSQQYVSYEKYMLLQKIMWAIGVDRIEYDIKCECYYTHHFSITLSDTKAIATPFNKQDYSYIVKRLK